MSDRGDGLGRAWDLLRVAWTKDGWMDTSEEEDVWDDDAYYAHLDDLDFD